MSFPVVIHHNPDCATSPNVLGIIHAAGNTPVVIDYLKEGWARPQLLALFAAAGSHRAMACMWPDPLPRRWA